MQEKSLNGELVNTPLVSVVVPVYNAQTYLSECLDSLLAQTYRSIELICVDDGSTDDSADILDRYAVNNEIVKVIHQANEGPGAARNVGIDAARGTYLYFFDSDDFCSESLVERAVDRLERANADIVVLPFFQYDERIKVPLPAFWALLRDRFPDEVFNWRSNPDWLFRAFQNLPWNKMFRLSFVKNNGLRFQDIRLTEDLMFSAPALVAAERITCLDEMLVYHREGTGANVMSAKDKHPLDFLEAFKALKKHLESKGLFEDLQVAYVNWAIDGFIYNLGTLNTYEGFRVVLDALVNGGGLRDAGLLSIESSMLQEEKYDTFLRDVCNKSTADYAYQLYVEAREDRDERGHRLAVEYYSNEAQQQIVDDISHELRMSQEHLNDYKEHLEETQHELDEARHLFDENMNAAEQKVGQFICFIPRVIQRIFLKR